MKYLLFQNGQHLGPFTLEELRLKRQLGQLTGQELVAPEGTTDWHKLDQVLAGPARSMMLTPERRAANRRFMIGVVAAFSVLVLVGFGVSVLVIKAAAAKLRTLKHAPETRGYFPSAAPVPIGLDRSREHAKVPVVTGTNMIVDADLEPIRREFRYRQWVEGYQLRGDHKDYADADALPLIQGWIDDLHPAPGSTNKVKMKPLIDAVIVKSVCHEPLVLTIAANALEDGDIRQDKLYEEALLRFDDSKHLAFPKFFAAANRARMSHNTTVIRTLDKRALVYLEQCFKDGSFSTNDVLELSEIFLHRWGSPFFHRNQAEVVRILRGAGEPFEAVACAMEGQREINLAWNDRGGKVYSEVSEAGRRGFTEHSQRARELLTRAWELHPEVSLYCSRMVYVEMGQGSDKMVRKWFDRATTAQLDNYNAWQNMRWAVRPRWGGSLDEMLDLGISAVDTGRFDTMVPYQLFNCIGDLENEMMVKPPEHIFGREDIWPHLQRMYEGYIKYQIAKKERVTWRGGYAASAYFAGQYQVCREQLEQLDWKLPLVNQHGWRKDLSLFSEEVAVRTGPLASQFVAAETAFTNHDGTTAKKLFTRLLNERQADERTLRLARARIATIDFEQKLAGGDWVDFQPKEDNDPLWHAEIGQYTVEADGSALVTSGDEGHLLYCRTPVGPEFELKGEFEFVRSDNAAHQAGILFGDTDYWGGTWQSVRFKNNTVEGQRAVLSWGWTGEPMFHDVQLKPGRNTFQIRRQSDVLNASLNDQPALQLAKLKGDFNVSPGYFRVALGAATDGRETVVRYRNVKIRKLTSTTPAKK